MIMSDNDTHAAGPAVRNWRVDRTAIALVLALAIGVVFSSVRYDAQQWDGLYPDSFWAAKASWRHNADVIVAGDSRVLTAISPAAMAQHLPGRRIVNYAFLGVGYETQYIEAIDKVLATDGPTPIIVLGVSPRSLTTGAAKQKWFGPEMKQHFLQRALLANSSDILQATRPIDYADLMASLSLAQPRSERMILDYHADGWQSADMIPPDVELGLAEYETKFGDDEEGPVRQEYIDQLLAAVKRWRAQGITVCGFRPPSCAQMVALENRISGFDEATFVPQFQAAGGIWLSVSQTAYASYDGSHLDVRSAPAFSADLAKMLK